MGYTLKNFNFENNTEENHRRLKETIKLFLLDLHVTSINVHEGFLLLDKSLTDMYKDIKNNFIEKQKRQK